MLRTIGGDVAGDEGADPRPRPRVFPVVSGRHACQHPHMHDRQPRASAPRAQTVLVVDDHDGFRARMRRLFERHGYRVIDAADGASAIAGATSGSPDLALLDVHLPDMDGFAVARELRKGGMRGGILLTSTRVDSDYAERLRTCSADGFIDKADLSIGTITALLSGRP